MATIKEIETISEEAPMDNVGFDPNEINGKGEDK